MDLVVTFKSYILSHSAKQFDDFGNQMLTYWEYRDIFISMAKEIITITIPLAGDMDISLFQFSDEVAKFKSLLQDKWRATGINLTIKVDSV